MTRAAGFAARVARRYARRVGRPRLLRSVVLRRPSPIVVRDRSRVVARPRIELALRTRTTARIEAMTVARAPSNVETIVRHTSRSVPPSSIGSGAHERVVQRLLERTGRVEVRGSQFNTPSRAAPGEVATRVLPVPSVPPVELVVARPASAVACPTPPPPDPPAFDGWGPPRPFARQAPEAPKVDVEALTDDVMRSIDRRIVAYRERTGRV